MHKFKDYDTEQYYYQKLRKTGIKHINWGSQNLVLTKEYKGDHVGDLVGQFKELCRESIDEIHIC